MVAGSDYAFVEVPRTASVSVSRFWLTRYYGGVEVQSGSRHNRNVPAEHRNKLIFAVVRDPYARMASLWALYRWNERFAVFDDWLVWVLENYREQPLLHCQSDFLATVRPRIDCILRYEALERELRLLPFVKAAGFLPLPMKNTRLQLEVRRTSSKHRAAAASSAGWDVAEESVVEGELYPERNLNPAQIKLVNQHSRLDFAKYGYEML